MSNEPAVDLSGTAALANSLGALADLAVGKARALTGGGKTIDDHQVIADAAAYVATQARAAQDLAAVAPKAEAPLALAAQVGVADLAQSAHARLDGLLDSFGLGDDEIATVFGAKEKALARRLGSAECIRAVGRALAESRGRMNWPTDDTLLQVQKSVRQFADAEVAPMAEHLHRTDGLIPDSLINSMAELGYFGLSVPEEFGGHELGNLAMILTTEELSRASLAGAGSLITRPEILAKALLAGGTDAQKQTWLPKIASGELMVGISVTEPNVGSDVASLGCRAEPATVEGVAGYSITGAKAWCTFAGRANILAVLLRTDADASKGAKGLSLFIVEKPVFDGHEFAVTQPGGGRLEGKADATPGYRGMHSFTLSFENYFVPADNLVGGEAGLGRGFYLQMAGFAAGRLQTGGRACGVAQAAVEKTAEYVCDRSQFSTPLVEFELTQYYLGQMGARLAAARAITYAAAEAMDLDERAAAPLAAQAKLLACDVAVEVTQRGQLLHGGWGYAEEYAISRYVVDALVLPIFEGVKPVLSLKVIARHVLA